MVGWRFQLKQSASLLGAQLSLAAGRLYAERALDDAYSTVNVRRFDLRRIMMGSRESEPLKL